MIKAIFTSQWVMSHTWMSHATHECVMPRIWMSHVTNMNASYHKYELVMSRDSPCVRVWERRRNTERRWSHKCMSHVTHMNESCHTHEWFMSHIWMSMSQHRQTLVTHMNESGHNTEWECRICTEWEMPRMNKSCHMTHNGGDSPCVRVQETREHSTARERLLHITCMNVLRHTYEWGILHIWMCHIIISHVWISHVTWHTKEATRK